MVQTSIMVQVLFAVAAFVLSYVSPTSAAVADIPPQVMNGMHQVLAMTRCVITGGACFKVVDGGVSFFTLATTEEQCTELGPFYEWERSYNSTEEFIEDATAVEAGIAQEPAEFKAAYIMMVNPASIAAVQEEATRSQWETAIGAKLSTPSVCGTVAAFVYSYLTVAQVATAYEVQDAFVAIVPLPDKLKISPVFRELKNKLSGDDSNVAAVRIVAKTPSGTILDGIESEIVGLVQARTNVAITLAADDTLGTYSTSELNPDNSVFDVVDAMAAHHGIILLEPVPTLRTVGGAGVDPAIVVGGVVGGVFAIVAGMAIVGHRRKHANIRKMKQRSAEFLGEKQTAPQQAQQQPSQQMMNAPTDMRSQQQGRREGDRGRDRSANPHRQQQQQRRKPRRSDNPQRDDVVSVVTEGGRRRKIEL